MKERTEQMKQRVIDNRKEINGVSLFRLVLPIGSPEMIKDIAYQLKGQFPEKMLFVGATAANGKPNLTVMVSDDLVAEGFHAAIWCGKRERDSRWRRRTTSLRHRGREECRRAQRGRRSDCTQAHRRIILQPYGSISAHPKMSGMDPFCLYKLFR